MTAEIGHNIASARLKSIIERIERLEEEKRDLSAGIREIYAEAKGSGYDPKVIRILIRRRRMTESERAEQDALVDIYTAELGMLGDTPLGMAAIRRLSRPPQPEDDDSDDSLGLPEAGSGAIPSISPEEVAAARKAGEIAAGSGEAITTNPYAPASALRAAFDEGWCQASASDGMDIPAAWRPTKKHGKKDDNPDGEGDGSDDAGDDGEDHPGAAA